VRITNGSIVDNMVNTPTNKEEEKVGVFNRLTMSKAQAQMMKESKKAKKEVEVNFFDNIHSQTILGKVVSLY
jgi:phage terminase Nu1 subunit (DNA packaging protein)